jgi:diguanylate cyclase (GGDEF)-like protein
VIIIWKQEVYDRIINIPLTIFASSIVIALVAKSYRTEHELLAQKNRELIRANERLHEISSTDYLTDIYNRRSIVSKLKAYIDDINIGGNKQLGILLFDIDDFKPVNDTYGHYIGDAVLKAVALALKKLFIDSSIDIGRYGGDEFLIVFNDMDESMIHNYMEEVQTKIKDIQLPHHIHIAISGGFIKYRIDRHRTVEKILIEADKRLYIAKQAGKDRIVAK